MLKGKSSMLFRSHYPHPGSVEVPEARLLPDGRVRKIRSTSGLAGLCVIRAGSPTVLLTRTRTGGSAVVKLSSSRVNSPRWGVGD